jgi:hypothetical protein
VAREREGGRNKGRGRKEGLFTWFISARREITKWNFSRGEDLSEFPAVGDVNCNLCHATSISEFIFYYKLVNVLSKRVHAKEEGGRGVVRKEGRQKAHQVQPPWAFIQMRGDTRFSPFLSFLYELSTLFQGEKGGDEENKDIHAKQTVEK